MKRNKQVYAILCYYLKQTGISFSKFKLKQMLSTHPEHESMYAMADVLDELTVEYRALRVKMEELQRNGFPAIVYLVEEGKRSFRVIEDIDEDNVYFFDVEVGQGIESLETFTDKWSGVALYAAQNEVRDELEQKKSLKEERLLRWRAPLAIVAALACLTAWTVSVEWSFHLICLVFLSATGTGVSILLTMHDFKESNRFLHKVCHMHRLTNCNAVLQSSAAKLFGWLSMSDIGLCYFSGSMLTLILSGVTPYPNATVVWLSALALFAFPYTVFSLWYQICKVKQVCPLCIGVISVLWGQTALAIYYWPDMLFFPVSPTSVFILFAGFALPIILWAYVKPLWKEYNRICNYEYWYLRLRHNPEVIRALFASEPARKMDFSADEIHLGTLDASLHITAALSLNCKPCIVAWNNLRKWLTAYPGLLWITVRFWGYNLLGTMNKELIDAMTGIYLQSGADAFCDALDDWYEHRDPQKWKAKYLTATLIPNQSIPLKNAQWEREQYIKSTPSIFVDDRPFKSELGDIRDLECLLKEMQTNEN